MKDLTGHMNLIGKNNWKLILGLALTVSLFACGEDKKETAKVQTPPSAAMREAPVFSEDSAYFWIEKQLEFGPRIPNSKAQEKCAQWLKEQLASRGAQAQIQQTQAKRYDGESLRVMNVIGSFYPEKKSRILLSAHWDSRYTADADEKSSGKPVPAANDGASGVAVLLELARLMAEKEPNAGVDIIFWDAEDQGTGSNEESWCLGSRYWAANPHIPGYKAAFGINLDMVGGVNTWFPQEQSSIYFAGAVVNKIWETANAIGYGEYFPFQPQDAVLDDHIYINKIAGIPMADIIARDINGKGFYEHWHTDADDIQHISKPVLKAVGQSVTQVVYNE